MWRVGLILLVGCAEMSAQSRLKNAVVDYNEAVRWGNLPAAQPFVPEKQLPNFFESHRKERGNLEINEYEVDTVVFSQKGERAEVRVLLTWSRRSEGLVHQTVALQTWKLENRDWVLVSEKRIEGEPLGWLP